MIYSRRNRTLTTYKKVLSLVFLSSLAAFGQNGNAPRSLDRAATRQARDSAPLALPTNTPNILGGGLVTEPEPNGIGQKVWLVFSQPGTYLPQITTLAEDGTCNGAVVPMNGIYMGQVADPPIPWPIFDSQATQTGMSLFPGACRIDVSRINGGRIEASRVELSPWQPKVQNFRVSTENIVDGVYTLSTSGVATEATVILGRGAIGSVGLTPFGVTLRFTTNVWLPPSGLTTLTICSKGLCESTTYERRLEVPVMITLGPPPGGKG